MPNLTEILTTLDEDFEDDTITLGEIVARFEGRGFGPLLLAPAILAILPTGAIPGVPAICALFIILVSVQLLIGKSHPWIPERLRRFSFSRKKFKAAFEKVKPWTKRFDKLLKPRLEFLTRQTATQVVALIAISLALIMIPLELIPLACAVPAFSIACFSVGLSARDGLFTLFALLAALGAVWMSWKIWPW